MAYWTKNRKAAVTWLLNEGVPRTITEATEAAERGELEIIPTVVARVFYDAEKAGLFGKVGGAYYPLHNPARNTRIELRFVEVAA